MKNKYIYSIIQFYSELSDWDNKIYPDGFRAIFYFTHIILLTFFIIFPTILMVDFKNGYFFLIYLTYPIIVSFIALIYRDNAKIDRVVSIDKIKKELKMVKK